MNHRPGIEKQQNHDVRAAWINFYLRARLNRCAKGKSASKGFGSMFYHYINLFKLAPFRKTFG